MKKITGPMPRHRYHRNCNCKPCLEVRSVLWRGVPLPDPPPMPDDQLQLLLNACHDYGTLHAGAFPTLPALKKARAEGRLFAQDLCTTGTIKITGEAACHITFTVD